MKKENFAALGMVGLTLVLFSTVFAGQKKTLSHAPNPNNPRGVSDYDYAKVKTVVNAKHLGTSIAIYCSDWDDLLPIANKGTKKWQEIIKPYYKKSYASYNPAGGDFVPNPAVSCAISGVEIDADTIIAYEQNFWEGGVKAYIFADGRAKFLDKATPKKLTKNKRKK